MTPAPALEGQPIEAPELDPFEQAKQQYGEHFEQLPEQLVNALREQVKEFQGQEKFLRRREVMRDRRNRFYERGVQHIYWNAQGNAPGFTGITAGGTTMNAIGQNVQAPNYVDDYNIYRRYLQINMAILTQTPAGIDFKPDDAGQSDDIEAAETAELYRHDFDRNNDVAALRQNTVRMFGVSGRTIRWTRTETNAQRYGTNPDGSPKQVEISSVYGTLESKVPILAKCQDDALYVFLSDDPDVKQMKAEYPEFADKIKAGIAGLGENAYERLARLGVLQGSNSSMLSADSYTHLTTRINAWMRPNSFTGDRYDEPFTESETPMLVGDKLRELFPEGCRAVFVGDVYVQSCPEAIEDCLCIEFPWEGDGMNREGFMDSFLVVQDSFNDAMNAAREVFDTGWPSTWIDTEAQGEEIDAIVQQKANPFSYRGKKLTNGQKMSDAIFREPNPELPSTFIEFMQDLQGPLPQFMLAAPPALFGASMEDQKTASGYAQARAQAMGQQGLIYAKLQKMDAVMYQQAAICASNNPQNERTIQVPGGVKASIDLGKLTKGNFKCYPANDSNLPESTAAKRSTIDNVLLQIGNTPIGMQMLQAPKNMRLYLDTHGLTDIIIPEAEAYDQELAVIDKLLEMSPIPVDPAQQDMAMVDHAAAAVKLHQSGQPDAAIPPPPVLQPTCSIPPQEWEFHQWAAQADQDWLNSEDCRRQLKDGNDAGVQNVVLRWKAHLAMIPPPMPVVSAPGDAPSPGGPPKPAGGPLLPQSVQPPGAPGMATM